RESILAHEALQSLGKACSASPPSFRQLPITSPTSSQRLLPPSFLHAPSHPALSPSPPKSPTTFPLTNCHPMVGHGARNDRLQTEAVQSVALNSSPCWG